MSTSKCFSWFFLARSNIFLLRSLTAWILLRYAAGSRPGSGARGSASSGREAFAAGELLNDREWTEGDFGPPFEVVVLMVVLVARESCLLLLLLFLKRPMRGTGCVIGWCNREEGKLRGSRRVQGQSSFGCERGRKVQTGMICTGGTSVAQMRDPGAASLLQLVCYLTSPASSPRWMSTLVESAKEKEEQE